MYDKLGFIIGVISVIVATVLGSLLVRDLIVARIYPIHIIMMITIILLLVTGTYLLTDDLE